ncbi:MAG: hypothetical protein WC854_05495, partial [Bacteroidales bacterium]
DGFLQILPHGKHPCHSLTLPVNPVCTGTYTLLVKELCPTYKKGTHHGVSLLYHLILIQSASPQPLPQEGGAKTIYII